VVVLSLALALLPRQAGVRGPACCRRHLVGVVLEGEALVGLVGLVAVVLVGLVGLVAVVLVGLVAVVLVGLAAGVRGPVCCRRHHLRPGGSGSIRDAGKA
jgi:hypothetical protein